MISSLIGEILEGSMTDTMSLPTLLRRVKVAAFRLNLPTLEDWVDKELNGYNDGDAVPDYRMLLGQVVAKSIYHGWRPVSGDPLVLSSLQTRSIGASIAQLEAMMAEASANNNSGTFTMFFSPELASKVLGKNANMTEAMGTRFAVGTISAILDRVRGKVLDWAIEMEKQGIVGEGMTFSSREKQEAARAMTSITFTGPIGTFAGNLGTGNSSGDITISSVSITEAVSLAQELQRNVQRLIEAGANQNITEAVRELNSELLSASPDKVKVRSLLETAKTALTGASGSLIATGALALIEKISQAF